MLMPIWFFDSMGTVCNRFSTILYTTVTMFVDFTNWVRGTITTSNNEGQQVSKDGRILDL